MRGAINSVRRLSLCTRPWGAVAQCNVMPAYNTLQTCLTVQVGELCVHRVRAAVCLRKRTDVVVCWVSHTSRSDWLTSLNSIIVILPSCFLLSSSYYQAGSKHKQSVLLLKSTNFEVDVELYLVQTVALLCVPV